MDVPLAQTVDLTCPQCGQAFTAEIWLIVDGSPHYLDYVEAADERKRRRLKALGYRVVVIRGEDLAGGLEELAGRVR